MAPQEGKKKRGKNHFSICMIKRNKIISFSLMPLNIPCLGLPDNRTEKIFKSLTSPLGKILINWELPIQVGFLIPPVHIAVRNSPAVAGAAGKSTGPATLSAPEELLPGLRYFRTPNHWRYFSSKSSHCACHFPMLPLISCSSCSLRFKELSVI